MLHNCECRYEGRLREMRAKLERMIFREKSEVEYTAGNMMDFYAMYHPGMCTEARANVRVCHAACSMQAT
jgi:hypothetical protein